MSDAPQQGFLFGITVLSVQNVHNTSVEKFNVTRNGSCYIDPKTMAQEQHSKDSQMLQLLQRGRVERGRPSLRRDRRENWREECDCDLQSTRAGRISGNPRAHRPLRRLQPLNAQTLQNASQQIHSVLQGLLAYICHCNLSPRPRLPRAPSRSCRIWLPFSPNCCRTAWRQGHCSGCRWVRACARSRRKSEKVCKPYDYLAKLHI